MEQGLAEMTAQVGPQDDMINQAVDLLMGGVSPDELVQQGMPLEVVKQAVEIVLAQEQQASMQQAAPSTEQGLAAMAGPQKMM